MKKSISFLLMYVAFFIYSISSILTKVASSQKFLSWQYILCFAGVIFVLGIYAILWQQVLKGVPLSFAMANKPVALVFGLLWAFLIFKDQFTWKMAVGIVLILAGVVLIGIKGAENARE